MATWLRVLELSKSTILGICCILRSSIIDKGIFKMPSKKQLNPLKYKAIPTLLTESEFNEFVLPHLSYGAGHRGPKPCISAAKKNFRKNNRSDTSEIYSLKKLVKIMLSSETRY